MANIKNSCIYKIVCKDPTITDFYIGSTTNFKRRCNDHRYAYEEQKTNRKVYEFIRNNGKFDNWKIIIIEQYPCDDLKQLHIRERYWIETLKSTLNTFLPYYTPEEKKERQKLRSTKSYKANKIRLKEKYANQPEEQHTKCLIKSHTYYNDNKEELLRIKRKKHRATVVGKEINIMKKYSEERTSTLFTMQNVTKTLLKIIDNIIDLRNN